MKKKLSLSIQIRQAAFYFPTWPWQWATLKKHSYNKPLDQSPYNSQKL